jgi:AraC-like DNA-binding protein
MRNITNAPETKTQDLTVLYPDHEDAVRLIHDGSFPIENILIGITHPYSSYRVSRVATNKYYVFEHILEGKGEIYINGKWYTLSQGDTFLINKRDSHHYHSNKTDPLKKIWISFASDYVDKMLEAYQISTGVYQADTKNDFLTIFNLSTKNVPPQTKFFAIAEHLHSIITKLASSVVAPANDVISVIKNELETSIYSKTTLSEIASKLFMSKCNLIRLFKKETGETPYQFLLTKKLKIAQTLLKTTTMSVKNISDLLCFSDEHYFSFLFKSKTGQTPSQCRLTP